MTSLWIGRFPYWSSRVAFALRVVRLWLFDDRCHSFFRFLSLFCLLTACTKEFPLEFIQCFPETGNCFFQVIDGFLQFCDSRLFSSNRSESIWIIRSFCLISLLKSMSCPFGSTVNPSLFFSLPLLYEKEGMVANAVQNQTGIMPKAR